MVKTPIVLIIFNRPSLTRRVFDVIRKVKPEKLFIISDGPRNEDERITVESTRKIIDRVDWKCEIDKKYSKTNLGCKVSVSSGLDWAFSKVDKAIILEDDCVPDPSFFTYCEKLLKKYEKDDTVRHISGTNLLPGKKMSDDSYFFTKHVSVWGWATWKRAWKDYDVKMKDFPSRSIEVLSHIFSNKRAQKAMSKRMLDVFNNKIDTWDYQWTWSIWKNGGLATMPQVNLISNIGFGADATHTKVSGKYDSMIPSFIKMPLVHPKSIQTNKNVDILLERNLLMEYVLTELVLNKIRSVIFTLKNNYFFLK